MGQAERQVAWSKSLEWVFYCQFRFARALALSFARSQSLAMHKDKPPGIFDLSERSMRYAAGFCFVVGFLASVLVRMGIALARDHFSQAAPWSGS